MSMESAKAFIEKMQTDEDFARKVNECKDNKDRMSFVKQAGYDFTEGDIELVKSELTKDELNSVAGGLIPGGLVCYLNHKWI